MNLRYIDNNYNNIWKDKNKNTWKYLDNGSFRKEKEEKAYFFGDVGIKGKDSRYILKDDNKDLNVYEYRDKIGFFEKIEGYILCEEETTSDKGYIRIINYAWGKIFSVFLILMLLLAGGLFMLKDNDGPELDKAAIAYEMPGGVINEDPESISLPGYSLITYRLSNGKITTPLINPEGNPCYFRYTIFLKETGEELYKSGYVKPGTAVAEYSLNRNFEKGQYDIIIDVEAADINDHTVPLNSGSLEAVLEVVD